MPGEESADWDSILEERLAREAARRPTAPLPEGAARARKKEQPPPAPAPAEGVPKDPSALAGTPSRAQFDGTAPFHDVPQFKQLSPEEELEAAEYLRSIPKARKLILALVLVAAAGLSGGGAFVLGARRPPPPEGPRREFVFGTAPAGLESFSAPPRPKVKRKPPEFVPGLDPLPRL